ncbi:ROK family protein [Cryobacterium tepidiphilum]|uniref:ROK family protein n=1 Tax=Cryobacterium tepidiphilum TaxID=2486026 RepID=A0A3M8LCC8_9MICO|nr:ROK family protein [Cryobacterium tepidiphilum]RNE62442.1 ROK family protein [Cryobacterium tepidiphilum]
MHRRRRGTTLITSSPTPFALAVDLGGTKIEAALVDDAGRILNGSRFREPTGRDASSEQLAGSVTHVVGKARAALPLDAEVIGIGVGTAGPIDIAGGTVSPLNLPAWRKFPLQSHIESLVPDAPVRLRMDGLCIALAEHWVGAGQGVDDLMGMTVSTGVGGGLILGSRTVTGPTGNAGHIGHVEVGGFDDACWCGGTGCLEAIASGPSTVAWAQGEGWTGSTGEQLAEAYAAGDDVARRAVQRSGRAIGQAIASATNLVDLDLVVIGGGFSRVTPDLLDFARESLAERTEFAFVTRVRIAPSTLSDEAPLIGAAALVHRAELVP